MWTRRRQSRRAFLRIAGTGAASAAVLGHRASASAFAREDRPVTAVTLIHGIAGKEGDLQQHLLSLTGPTRAEEGCITYDLYQSPDRAHEFMRFEVWTSTEALEAHKKTPPLRASFEKRQREGWTTEILTWTRVPD